ncbi:MAG: TetR/AcrR family transcriptional regulator [Polyangiaceae bacterium]|nr:TetR/AcrR family transcriptional regulator [Polyangiaceae bacterium]
MGVEERRQREREERKSRIIDAAEQVFLTQGLAGATMADIARSAELSKGTLYLYFESKDELYLEIALRVLTEVESDYLQAVEIPGTGLERLERFLHIHATQASEDPSRFQVALSWLTAGYVVSGSATFEAYQSATSRLFLHGVAALQLGIEDKSVRSDLNPATAAVQLWGGLAGVLLLSSNEKELGRRVPSAGSRGALVPGFIDILVAGIRSSKGKE